MTASEARAISEANKQPVTIGTRMAEFVFDQIRTAAQSGLLSVDLPIGSMYMAFGGSEIEAGLKIIENAGFLRTEGSGGGLLVSW